MTALLHAAKEGNTALGKVLVEGKADVNVKSKEQLTALLYAAKQGNTALGQALVEGKADLNDQRTALMFAAMGGSTELGLLLSTELGLLLSTELGLLLLEGKADLHAADKDQRTALMFAAMGGSTELGQLLLEGKADLHAADKHGDTALHLALRYGHFPTAEVLVAAGGHIRARNKANKTLREIDLEGKEIGDAGAQALGEALKEKSSCIRVGIYANEIGDAGAQALGEALKVTSTLCKLYLARNRFTTLRLWELFVPPSSFPERWHTMKINLIDLSENNLRLPPQEEADSPYKLRKYLSKLQSEGGQQLSPVRAMVIGHGGAGKTTLCESNFRRRVPLSAACETWSRGDVDRWAEQVRLSPQTKAWLATQDWSVLVTTDESALARSIRNPSFNSRVSLSRSTLSYQQKKELFSHLKRLKVIKWPPSQI
eukprot:g55816.t1